MKSQSFIILLVIFVFSITIQAQNFNDALRLSDPGLISNPRALGMGNAYTGVSNDFGASLFNPAGFALIRSTEFSGSFNYNSFKNQTTFFGGQTDYKNSLTNINQIGFAFPFPTTQGSFVIGFGYNEFKNFNSALKFNGYNPSGNSMIQDLASYNDDIAYDLGLSYPLYDANGNYIRDNTVIDGKLNQSGTINQTGGLKSWNLSAAVEFQKDLFFGITVGRINGNFNRNRQYTESDVFNNYPSSVLLDPDYPETADFQSFYFNDIIKWDVTAWDFTFGLMSKLGHNMNIGFTYKLPRHYTIKETYYVDANSEFGTGQRYYLDPPIENKVRYDIATPAELTAGASFQQAGLTVSFDAKMIDYTQMKFENGLDISDIEANNSDIKDLFRTVFNLHAGAEFNLPVTGLSLRAGFMLLPSPYKDDPSDYDKKVATVGLGINSNDFVQFNVAYSYGWWKDYGDNYGSNVSRTFQNISHSNLIIGMKYNF